MYVWVNSLVLSPKEVVNILKSLPVERGVLSGSTLFAYRNFYKKWNKNVKNIPDSPKIESGLVQMIMMGKYIRQMWVKCSLWFHRVTHCDTTGRCDLYLIVCDCTACRFDNAYATSDVQRHCKSTIVTLMHIFKLRARWVLISWSNGSEFVDTAYRRLDTTATRHKMEKGYTVAIRRVFSLVAHDYKDRIFKLCRLVLQSTWVGRKIYYMIYK